MQHAVVKRKLPGDVALESHRAVNATTGGEEQMVMLVEINHGADVERGALIGKVGLVGGLMIDFQANEHMGQLIAYARMTGVVPPWSKNCLSLANVP